MLTRRSLLKTGVAAIAASALPVVTSSTAHAAGPDLAKHPLIDAHSHIWSPDTDKWPLEKGQTKADLAPPSFTPEELFAVAHPVGVGRVVLIQHHIYHGWNNTYLTDSAASHPGAFSVVGMIDDQQPHADTKMDALLKKHVRGFRITPFIYKDKWLSSDGMSLMWKHAAKTGQSMCCLIDAQHLEEVGAMCEKHPHTRVVIDHFARIGADGEVRDADVAKLCALAKHKHTHVKISAYYALGKKKPPYLDLVPMIRKVFDAYGPERTMWASDAPYQIQGDNTYQASIDLVKDKLDFLTAGDRDWLLRKTAEKVFFSV
ncbi:MAG: amidohydrolase family protein [Planctomycetota bacterium]|nr:amidohydrolase family protein [Planctomycetota bacterium]